MKLIFSLSLFLFSVTTLLAQTLYTRNDSIPITQDSVTLRAGQFRGNIQWQKSLDNINWINMEGKTNDSLRVKTAIEAKYRAAITDGMCLPVYSDSVAIVTADTITNNYVDPGETGLILISDSTNISNGDYIYTGADATNDFEIGKVIIDEQAGGTIRRITEVIQIDDTVSVKTDQATMEDLFQGASFKLSTEMVYPEQNMKSASIAVIEKALTDKEGFIHPVEVIFETPGGIRMKSTSIYKRSENAQGGTLYMHKDWSGTKLYDLTGSFKLPNKNGVLVSYSGNVKSYISEGYFTFDPIFKFEFEFDRPRINLENFNVSKGEITKFKFYSDRSQIDFKNILAFESTIAYEFGKEWTLVPKIINSKFKFLVGGVYIWIDFKIDINCSLTAEFASGTITTQGFENNNYITIGAGYENKNWYTIKDIEKENQVFASNSGFTNSGFRFEIFPSVEIKLYSIVGPYFKVGPYLSYESTKSLSENWDKKIDVGVDANLGVSVDVFGREIASLNAVNWNFFNANLWKAPRNIQIISGNNQSAQAGNILPEPIAVKVTNSLNQPVNDVQVHFLPSSGSVGQPMVKTDANGLSQTSWTLSNNAGEQSLKVYLLDGKDQQIEGCSQTVLATATNTNFPNVTTNSITDITQTTATSGGNVTSDGGATVTTRGVCWNTSQNPTTANSKTTNGSGTGIFTSNLTGLTANATYYVRAYATNSTGTAYGNEVTFTTGQAITQPTVTTNSITAITQTTATSGGNVTSDGGATVTARGVCWSTSQNPTTANGKTTDGTGTGSFTSNLTGLTANTLYYLRAYATNSAGTAYGSQESFTTQQETGDTVTDIDGNVYHTVTIGTQVWMVENLKTTRYNDGTSIPNVTDNSAWGALSTGAYCWNKNDISYKNPYGALYNWYTVNTGNLAPTGWHVPTDAEWTTLTTFLGGESVAGGKLKEAGTTHWASPNTGATNEFGFSALPAGLRAWDGAFISIGYFGDWWSSTKFDPYNDAWERSMNYSNSSVSRSEGSKHQGYSVRCIKDDNVPSVVVPTLNTFAVSSITQTTATCGGNVTSEGGATITARGVCWSTSQNPTTANGKTTDGTGTGSFTSNLTGLTANTPYYVRAYATNSAGTAYGNQVNFTTEAVVEPGTVTDIDGNVYHTVTIGTQVWMVENLKTTKYNDGTSIPNVTDNTAWANLATPGYCWYNNDISYKNPYGALYNWYTVNTGKLAPSGWHVPSDAEWTTLMTFLGGESVAGGKLKEAGTTHWLSPNTGATNETGFTALPGGHRNNNGTDDYNGKSGTWWSSSEGNTSDALARGLSYTDNSVGSGYSDKRDGFAVRCIRDDNVPSVVVPTLNTFAVSSISQTIAISGGNVTSDGGATVSVRGVCWSTSQKPTTANSKTTDGTGTGSFTSNLTGLTANTPYHLRAYATNSAGTAYGNQVSFTTEAVVDPGTVTDIDGNIYHTVTIGTQVWMVENLKTTRFNDGTSIPNVTDATAWGALSTGAYCWYNNDISYKNPYGALYNWYTVNTGKLAPSGWHVSTDAEWTTLTIYLGSTAGGKLKEVGTTHWLSPNTGATNVTGFTALPGGYRNTDGGFKSIVNDGHWWSSTEYNTYYAWYRYISFISSDLSGSHPSKALGCSVRCIKD